ncbi:RloB domain-containing protein [uncultured Sphaerochaeta sp.]|uniref:RloB domain-containing protein n=1 Tax=uncultured Sphaerochaeta sp. TaxID=886478 RepID=UPI002A0A2048|nr:RloB domain-containing protein [uncultured Sphaerochaeta sp.]
MQKRKKFFFAFEGTNTEPIYFNGLFRSLQESSTQPSIFEILLFSRKKTSKGKSNPKVIFEEMERHLKQRVLVQDITYREIVDYYFAIRQPQIKGKIKAIAFRAAQKILSERNLKESSIIEHSVAESIIADLEEYCETQLSLTGNIDTIAKVFENFNCENLTYEPEIDEVCLIVDRDCHSFTENQFDLVVAGCEKAKFHFFVTNPNFEFWLLLHKSDCKQFLEKDLLENKKIGKYTFTERMLSKILSGYDKSNYSFDTFKDGVEIAQTHARLYETTLKGLKFKIGTNLPALFDLIKTEANNTA